ncbi:MAG: hypothetical protein Q8877_02625, partial [Sweet potato little leaf phytoplasma]|nr:hypothetical protein [Sweet potato little leaf phytoplasma]
MNIEFIELLTSVERLREDSIGIKSGCTFLISITNSPHLNRTSKFPSIRLAIIYPLLNTKWTLV